MNDLIRAKLFAILEIHNPDSRTSNGFERFMFCFILLNVLITVLESVQGIKAAAGIYVYWFDMVSLAIFTSEYLARLWVCTLHTDYRSPFRGRVRYMMTPLMILDLLVIVPFFIPFFLGDTRFILVFRILRIARILKLTRYSKSLSRLGLVILKKRDDLVASAGIVLMLLIISASIMYHVENSAQPDKFSSIPAAMWWGIATLTTVGYGDVFPITSLGKFIGAFIALLGIGMVAVPTGIIGSGFLEEMQAEKAGESLCPHCGKKLEG